MQTDELDLKKLKPLTVDHHNTLLYDGLRSCMQKNTELHLLLAETQQQLVTALQTIQQLTEALSESRTSPDNSRCC